MQKLFKHQSPALIWALFILIICCASLGKAGESPLFFKGFDKLTHTGLFFVLTIFTLYGLLRKQAHHQLSASIFAFVLGIMFLFGGAIELLQLKVFTYRSAEWADLFCDVLGTLMGIFSVSVTTYAIQTQRQ
ncbi:VanZ family protein [Mucilaginibacter sp.]|uniref:VanZ family protein n=1 Tax=Mucilaginibacter sp. TaxID=1882438 RepID=UPI003B00C387